MVSSHEDKPQQNDMYEWRLTVSLDNNNKKYNLELVYKNKDRNWFQKISDKILELNTGIAAPYKHWFKLKHVNNIRKIIQDKYQVKTYIENNSNDLDNFLNFGNTTLQEIINNHNIIENLK